MDLHKIFQLIKRHLFLLITVPIVMAVLVYFFTRNTPKSYSSEAIIYTGIATGYSLESTSARSLDYFAINVQFDNLINLFNSGQTIENTSINLLAQELSLANPNPQYISVDNYYALQRMVPKSVKNLVVKNGKMGLEREKEQQIRQLQNEIQNLESVISIKKNSQLLGNQTTTKASIPINTGENVIYHTVRPGESIYSIASQYGVSAEGLMDKNNLKSNVVSAGQTLNIKNDIPTNNLYHNVVAGETIYSIAKLYNVSIRDIRRINNLFSDRLTAGTRLIIRNLTPDNANNMPSLTGLYDEAIANPRTLVSREVDLARFEYNYRKDPVVPPGIRVIDFRNTVNNFTNYYNSSDTNFIYELLHYDHKNYSIQQIRNNTQVVRIQNSDLVRVRFNSDDPGICQQTLKILAQVFIRYYKGLKANETDAVVAYYQRKVEEADAKLQAAEEDLLRFNTENNIINYYEQSKYIAAQKEDLDLYYQNEQIKLAAANAALDEVETKLNAKDSIYVKSDAITKKMKQISELSELIVINEISNEYNKKIASEIRLLKAKKQKIANEVKAHVDQLYLYTHSNEGIPIKELLAEYLDSKITYVEAKASLRVLNSRKADFTQIYRIFAPLGAMLKRIEREINVAELSYMEFLRSFNEAKMKQQNNQLATNIKIVDEPSFPIKANASKTKLLIVVAAFIGFFMVAFIILMLEFFDTTVKDPEAVEKAIGGKLAGAFPILEPGVDSSYVSNRLIEIILQNIKLQINHNSIYSSEKPYFILVFSTQKEVGKTTIATELIKKLRSYGENVLFLNYTKEGVVNDEDLDSTIMYDLDNKFVETKHINELLVSKYLRQDNYKYDYIFLELPALVYNSYPLELMNSIDVSILITRATDHWRKADISALKTMEEVTREKPMIILNQTELYALEDIINDIPERKQRSIRRKVKAIITYPFRMKVKIRVD